MKPATIPFLAFSLWALCARAEELEHLTPDPQLLLPAAVQAAYERSPRQPLLNAGRSMVAAKQTHASGALPSAPAVLARHQNDAIGSGRNLMEWEAGLEIPLWLPGQRAAREAVASEANTALESDQTGLRLLVSGYVRDAIWDVAMNGNAVALAEVRLKTAQALQTDVEKRWKAGELARTDTLLVANETLQAQTALLRAQAELKHAEHRYWILTGLKQIPQSAQESLSSRRAIDDQHPLLAELAARVAIARGERNLVQVERRENPQLALNARHERGAFDNDYNSSIGLSLRIPLDSGVRAAPMLATAELALGEALSRHGQQLMELQAALHEAEHSLEVTRQELTIYEAQNRLAQENLRLAKKAFDLGESDLVSLLRVQALARETEVALASRRIQLNWDVARYNQAVGVLP